MKHLLKRILDSEDLVAAFLKPHINQSKKVVIDYSSPNLAKHFHLGNLRSTLVGKFIDSINRKCGHSVVSINYLGDWGTQFALISAMWDCYEPSKEIWMKFSVSEKVHFFTKCYVDATSRYNVDAEFRAKVRKINERMETEIVCTNQNENVLLLWKTICQVSICHLRNFYNELNIDFDEYSSESRNVRTAHGLIDDLIHRGIAVLDDDKKTVINEPNNSRNIILRKSNNCSLYLSRDLSELLRRRKKYSADEYLYVVDESQSPHFTAIKKVLNVIAEESLAQNIRHIAFGRVLGQSTRKGKTDSVEQLVESGRMIAADFIRNSKTIKIKSSNVDDVAKNLTLSIVIANDFKRGRMRNYSFSFANAFDMHNDNGVLLQMKHSRLVSLEKRNCGLLSKLDDELAFNMDLTDNNVVALLKLLKEFEGVLIRSYTELEPQYITVYLIHLSNLIGSSLAALKIIDQPVEKALPRLLLFIAARKLLNRGMELIGIQPLEQM